MSSTVALNKIAQPILRPIDVITGTLYRTIGVRWWGEGAYERESIDGSQTAAKTLSIVREGDLIINKIWVRHGSIAIVGKEVDGCAASGEFPTFELDTSQIFPRWLYWFIKSPSFWEKCAQLSQGTSGKNRIKPELFLTIEIPLPPLDEQRRIVARIEELAAKVVEARGLRRQSVEYGLPSLRNGIFRKAFQGKLLDYSTNEFHKDEISSIGKWVRLGDICSLITDGTHQTPTYTEKGMIFLSAQNIKPYRFMPENHKYVSYEDYLAYTARNKVQKGDILITRVGAGIGEVAMVDQDIDFAIYVSLGHIRAIQDFVYK